MSSRSLRTTASALLLILSACSTRGPGSTHTPAQSSPPPLAPYPPTAIEDTSDTLHGRVVPDPYRWLEDGKDERVVAWGRAQDERARQRLEALPSHPSFLSRLKS